jgi:hypothetical protein
MIFERTQMQAEPEEKPLIPLSEASERVRYIAHHHDMMVSFHDTLDVARIAGVYLTRDDVSAECAAWLDDFFALKNCGPTRAPLRAHWRPDLVATTQRPPGSVDFEKILSELREEIRALREGRPQAKSPRQSRQQRSAS